MTIIDFLRFLLENYASINLEVEFLEVNKSFLDAKLSDFNNIDMNTLNIRLSGFNPWEPSGGSSRKMYSPCFILMDGEYYDVSHIGRIESLAQDIMNNRISLNEFISGHTVTLRINLDNQMLGVDRNMDVSMFMRKIEQAILAHKHEEMLLKAFSGKVQFRVDELIKGL